MLKIFLSVIVITSSIYSQLAFSEEQPKTHQEAPNTKTVQQTIEQKKMMVSEQELEEIIDRLSPTERKTIVKVQKEIADWPQSVFDEISNYREFVITARKIAIDKYNNLSPEARKALETEKTLKAQLSPATVKFLETIQLSSLQKTR